MSINFFYRVFFNYLDKQVPGARYQLLQLGDCYICIRDINKDTSKNAISSTGTCGISSNPEIAKIKTLAEFVEREAFYKSGASSSTGFAAYPFIFRKNRAYKQARTRSLNELIERYALYHWAEHSNVKFTIEKKPDTYNAKLYASIQKEIPFSEYYKIIPWTNYTDKDCHVAILYALTNFGWVFGSAANQDVCLAEQNALKELYMNSLGLHRMKNKGLEPSSLYEKQIFWISTQDELIRTNIANTGSDIIHIPTPFFKNIPTSYFNYFKVVQCYFASYPKSFLSSKHHQIFI